MDAFKNETVLVQYLHHQNSIVWYFISAVNGTLLHYYHINFVINSNLQDPRQYLMNDNFTVVSIVKRTFKE